MRPTLKDVCREALVSEATVSRVVNNSPLVHERTRERVQEVIRRLGYTPNAAARNLSRSKTDVIGVVFHQVTSGFFAQVLDGVDREAVAHGYHLLCALTRDDMEAGKTCLGMFDEMRVDGMLILDPALGPELLEQFKTYRRPIVLIQQHADDATINSVGVENEQGAYEAMKHLLGLGYKDFLVVRGPAGAQDSQLRVKGCNRALREAGAGAKCRFVEGNYSPADALAAFQQDRAQHGLPRAIFALNDAMALSILKELQATGVRVPEQTAIMGFDGIECADYVGLSTVETPMCLMGEEAVRLFVRHVGDPKLPAEHVTLKTCLAVRKTCGG
ncbi:MAG: Catabolite control protein A [Verrucomicrobia bacterium ADurb.Bin345]|nr:MAG: Catabolite control protein A [Verrucomicrobia bacterium ADurb.Bin345]